MGDSSRPVTAEETEVSAEGVCEKHGEDVHLFCMEDQIPLCAVRRESKAHELHTEIPREQTASMKYQGTGSSRSGWKEELRPSTSGDSNITSDSKENGEKLSGNEKDHTDELMLMEQWVDFNFSERKEEGTRSNSRIQNSIIWIVLVVFTIQIVGLVTTILVFTMAKTDVRPSVTPTPCCPHGWIMSQGRCFHFLDLEGGWDAGQQHCSSLGASLAVIDNFEKLNQSVAVHHKGPFNHWVGLLRQPGESWKWPDGTAFNNQFEVGGDGPCAYLNNGIVSSTDCSTEKKYLCSQRARQERSPGHCRET
ncbi:C-type lectin domain family 2 member D-like isoform X1 [Sphaerodactylus townsendi]|uniref:C-type lectin domain family 2 member D-like isoform X1 n=1 Tax=Sphaerodactylus townsendi TaxID=933632 RepID=UPI002025FFB1|nr:C-type lectin domain family 2 member D-like isoform X1 [Sphaerodactylus townsendi]